MNCLGVLEKELLACNLSFPPQHFHLITRKRSLVELEKYFESLTLFLQLCYPDENQVSVLHQESKQRGSCEMWRRKHGRKLQLWLLPWEPWRGFKTVCDKVVKLSGSGCITSFFCHSNCTNKSWHFRSCGSWSNQRNADGESPEPGADQNKQRLSTLGLAAPPSPGHRDLETSETVLGFSLEQRAPSEWALIKEVR